MQIDILRGIITAVMINIVHCLLEFWLNMFQNRIYFLNHVPNKSGPA